MSIDMDEACNRTSCKEWHEHVYWDHQPRRVKFCKTLIGDFSQRMSIPKKFVTRFKGTLSEIIDVKDPGGTIWHIGLAKVAGNIFLQYGWEEFVEAHHLEKKDILFFEYEGDSCFSVSMFDSSECERESSYFAKDKSSTKRKIAQEIPQEISNSDVASIHNLEEPSSSEKYKRVESCCIGRDEQNVLIPKPETAETSAWGNDPGNEPLLTKAMQLALAFQPTRPSFISQIRKYHIRRKHFLSIPSEFAKKHLPNRNMEIILHLPNGKETWKVNFYFSGNSSYYFSKWRSFFEDNALEEGDVCVFEHSGDPKQIAMAVHIYRVKSGGT